MSLAFGLARQAVEIMADKNHEALYKAFTDAVKPKDVINAINNNDFDLKKISIANIDLDSINIYNNYISQPSNTNFNLNGTIDVENSQKQIFENNFNIYILQNIYDNYAILNNIISSSFKNPTDFVSTQNPVNLFYQVGLTNNSTNGLLLDGLGSSTFTNTNSSGVSIMISFLKSLSSYNGEYIESKKSLQKNKKVLIYINFIDIFYKNNELLK
jgi:hypothetical protein